MTVVTKGMRVLVREQKARPTALSGMQMKFGMTVRTFTGTVRHVRGDHPNTPTEIHIWVEPDENPNKVGKLCEKCGVLEVEVDQKAIAGVIKDGQ